METKHEVIIRYIRDLQVGTKVSVRQIAKELDVSEGTAYRAIKEAESQGLVSSIPKVGTIRIEDVAEKELEDLNLREISLIVEGEVLCGHEKLGTLPQQFVIGSTTEEVLGKYIEKQALLLVGDREEMQLLGLEKGAALLVTGGFMVSDLVLQKGKSLNLPIITCPYDTFVTTSMINRAVYERLTYKELVRVEDIMVTEAEFLSPEYKVSKWHELAQRSGHSRFPVVDHNGVLVGIVSAVDAAGADPDASILAVMTADVLTAGPKTLVTHLSRVLVWEGFELVPVVDDEKHLIGVVSRQDILKAFQQTQRQPQVGETVDNLTLSGFKLGEWEGGVKLEGEITEFMVSEMGTASVGTVVMIMSTAAFIAIRKSLKWDTVTENFTLYQMSPPAVGEMVDVFTKILQTDKKTCTVEIEMYSGTELKGKALTTARVVKK
ncbi:MAG: transcriptional regulator [Clostridiaceae bacterium BRH_c20a]|nr:MAG: transcriptional regulator [Clostridiaceae bacterium BRH_c20a]